MDIGLSQLIIMNNKQFYIKTKNGKIGPLAYEDLFNQELSHNSRIWFTGAADWEKLKYIPELKDLSDSIPPTIGAGAFQKNKYVIWSIILLGLCLGAYWSYSKYPNMEKEKPSILTIEDTNNRISPSVFLIRHEYSYKFSIRGEDYYFNKYDRETGEVSQIKTLNEVKKDPIIIWGTGFLLDSLGRILTCKHIVDVKPNEKDIIKISEYLKDWYQQELSLNIDMQNFTINNYEYSLRFVDSVFSSDYRNFMRSLSFQIDSFTLEINKCKEIINDISSEKLVVTKTTFKFGIFKNGYQSHDFSDPIECRSIKLSEDDKIDLAIIEPIDGVSSLGDIKPISLKRLNDPEKRKLNLDEPLRMIGYNDGLFLAKTSSGIKSQITEGRVTQNDDQYKILYSIASLPGSSGSPILDEYGNLVSVNFAGRSNSQSFNFGISPYFVYQFIK
jgi:hypothetical protein